MNCQLSHEVSIEINPEHGTSLWNVTRIDSFEDFKDVISAVLLYWDNKFLTIVTAED